MKQRIAFLPDVGSRNFVFRDLPISQMTVDTSIRYLTMHSFRELGGFRLYRSDLRNHTLPDLPPRLMTSTLTGTRQLGRIDSTDTACH